MLNPANLFAPKSQTYVAPTRTSTSISIDKLVNDNKSKWDQPITVPTVLYAKFKVPVPGISQTQNKNHSSIANLTINRSQSIEKPYQRTIQSSKVQMSQPFPNSYQQKIVEPPQISSTLNAKFQLSGAPQKLKTKEIILNSKKVEKTCPKITDKPNPERTIVPEKPKTSEREKNFEKTKPIYEKIHQTSEKSKPVPQKIKPNKAEKALKNESLSIPAIRFSKFKGSLEENAKSKQTTSIQPLAPITDIIVGKSKRIEKHYLRITGTPNPETIRPLPILKKALKYFMEQYKKGKNYQYLIDQFKSIRQDLTVQNIKNSFTVQVYEENLKISLFEGDRIHFKQCQTTLWQLYCQGLIYKSSSRNKFIGYQMITLIMEQKFEDLEFMLVEMPEECHSSKEVHECLLLKRMYLLGNYRGIFDFYAQRDEVCRCLLNQYIDKIRIKCLLMVCKTFGQKISLPILAGIIGEDEDLLEAMIKKQGGIIEDGNFILKPSYEKLIKSQHLASKKVSILFN